MKQKIIFFDIEGGHGGSSRSLYYTLCGLSLSKFEITVICKKNSWLRNKYIKKGIKCKIFKEMPCFSSLKGWANNILLLINFVFFVWPKFYKKRKNYIKLIKENDIIHLNQISLVFFGLWIKKLFPNKIITMHIRTMPYNNFFSKVKIILSKKICKKFIFISKKDKEHMCKIINNENIKGKIISNPSPNWNLPNKKSIDKINIASLSNYDFERGTDRIVEIASMMPKTLQKYYIFHMIGDYKIKRRFRNFFSYRHDLRTFSKKLGIESMFRFYGHKKFPEKVLNQCQYLIKLTRENNAWGRDVIESMYLGLGIIAIGNQNQLIKNNFNGFLFKEYDKKKIAKYISSLNEKKKLIIKHQNNSKLLSNKFFNKKNIANQFEKFWLSLSKTI